MPLAQITLLEGSDDTRKVVLIAEVTAAIAKSLDLAPEAVRVLLTEIPAAHWGMAGHPMTDRPA